MEKNQETEKENSQMISYKPLYKTLIDKNLNKTDLQNQIGISSRTLAKFTHNEPVALSVLEKICLTLNCRIEDVIEVLPEDI